MTFKQGPSAAWVDTGTVWRRCSETNRQEEIISFISGMTCLLYPVKLEDMAFIGKYWKRDSYFSHLRVYGKKRL